MPIYEYECEKCSHVTEALRSMSQSDDPLACESCGSVKVHRLQSEFAAGGSKSDAECPLPMGGGCGRCGDPNGPCGMG